MRWRSQRSAKACRVRIEGTEPEFTGHTAFGENCLHPEKLLWASIMHTGTNTRVGAGTAIGLIEFDDVSFDRTTTITLESLQAVLRRVRIPLRP